MGAGITKFGTYVDVTHAELSAEAALLMLDDAGISPGKVDALCFRKYLGGHLGEQYAPGSKGSLADLARRRPHPTVRRGCR